MTFVTIAINKVIDVNFPSAIVPPNLEKEKIIKPKKSIIEV